MMTFELQRDGLDWTLDFFPQVRRDTKAHICVNGLIDALSLAGYDKPTLLEMRKAQRIEIVASTRPSKHSVKIQHTDATTLFNDTPCGMSMRVRCIVRTLCLQGHKHLTFHYWT